VQEESGSTATATVDDPEQSEHREDGSRTSVPDPDHNPPKDGGLDTAQSLWDRAYAALAIEDPELVENYEKVLSRELSQTSVYQLQGVNRGR
jgi:hypothetical protein